MLSQPLDLQSIPDRRAPDIETEVTAFQAAVGAAKQELRASSERMRMHLPGEILSLFDAYTMMLESGTGNGREER